MFQRHWDELGMLGSNNLSLNIDEAYYTQLEATNRLVGIGCKNDDTNEMLGYLIFAIYAHPHHKGTLFAQTDCFIIDKQFRKKSTLRVILEMFELGEKILKEEYGVKYIQLVSNTANDLSRLAHRMGYICSDVTFLKEVE
jgi:hypothetical protein